MDGPGMSMPANKECCSATTSSAASNGNSGKSSSTESADGEEQEDSSSSSSSNANNNNSIEDELSSFRQKWQEELQISKGSEKEKGPVKERKKIFYDDENENKVETLEDQAKKWFLQGVENEKTGKLYDAILCYKKAVQLVPDIEFKLFDPQRQKAKDRIQLEGTSEIINERSDYSDRNAVEVEDVDDDDDDDDADLIMKFQRLFSRSKCICEPEIDQKTTHISALPMEIILYIFRWVVSYDLDLRSLEMCSMVCRGFYLCSRDSEIWRVACLKVWGVNCGGLTNFDNWRMMYLGRPRLNFNGCYISKTTYIRHGENSFQDQFYRPWHVVEYYRYLRFFPEGTVLMLTTPDQPVPILNLLKKREARSPSILSGHYRLRDDKVTIILHRQDLLNNNRYRGRRSNIPNDLVEQTFHIELQVITLKNRLNNQLLWRKYTVMSKRGNTDTRTNFDVSSNKFPPFWFSRVKSYTAESDRPL
ncbi:UNVERIFIED_CONTAM: hypothetical protein PYX00_002708 [Menopon gallinae]